MEKENQKRKKSSKEDIGFTKEAAKTGLNHRNIIKY